ncbi:hypothetical protein ASPSYDRAFT_38287 [Aspergillus sydowii CBS 593.65]|uniref:Uncharacterized protein n=1 Tax=Aspergillus sydowii CBS 593.65 TaxID=1036612 RepID=A0A1L9TW52_9EURO|nr:uncharacterized protein ASPSYDRAFT_38287 [Aspergillus sydowii CBS 593.65]OJJ63674.1 hypothetical protein ASPSYDRAFT_38287 [Aspergillus sydowii CBS 593.65]
MLSGLPHPTDLRALISAGKFAAPNFCLALLLFANHDIIIFLYSPEGRNDVSPVHCHMRAESPIFIPRASDPVAHGMARVGMCSEIF